VGTVGRVGDLVTQLLHRIILGIALRVTINTTGVDGILIDGHNGNGGASYRNRRRWWSLSSFFLCYIHGVLDADTLGFRFRFRFWLGLPFVRPPIFVLLLRPERCRIIIQYNTRIRGRSTTVFWSRRIDLSTFRIGTLVHFRFIATMHVGHSEQSRNQIFISSGSRNFLCWSSYLADWVEHFRWGISFFLWQIGWLGAALRKHHIMSICK